MEGELITAIGENKIHGRGTIEEALVREGTETGREEKDAWHVRGESWVPRMGIALSPCIALFHHALSVIKGRSLGATLSFPPFEAHSVQTIQPSPMS